MIRLVFLCCHRWLAAVALLCLLLAAPVALAQQALGEPASQQISAEELETLVATLEDKAERQKLIEQLRVLIEARRAQAETPAARLPETRGVGL